MSLDKVALVTGASSGIGEAISKELVRRGWQVIGVARSVEKLDQLHKELSESFLPIACDVSQKEQIIKASSSILGKGLIPSLFFLNAGIAGEPAVENPDRFDLEVHEKIMKVNYMGVLAWVEYWENPCRENGGANFIATSSINAIFAPPTGSAYAASKAAIAKAFEGLALTYHDSKLKFSIVFPGPVATAGLKGKLPFYEWGPWVNGGAWIHTNAGKIDWLYRNIDQMDRVLADAERGLFSWDFRQQPPFGFFSVTYLADLHDNIILYDPKGICKKLKSAVATYPEPLRQAIIQEHLWSVEFSLMNAKKYAARACIYATVGCMTRMAAELTQVLFALNRIYFVTEKGALETIDTFAIRPESYAEGMNAVLSHPGTGDRLINSLKLLEGIVQEVIALADPIYKPKYKGAI